MQKEQTEARQHKKQKRKAQEGNLQMKRQEMDKAKVCATFTFSYSCIV